MNKDEAVKKHVILFNKLVDLDKEATNRYVWVVCSIALAISIAISCTIAFFCSKLYLNGDEINELRIVANDMLSKYESEDRQVIIGDYEKVELTSTLDDKKVIITQFRDELVVTAEMAEMSEAYVKIIKDSEGNIKESISSLNTGAILLGALGSILLTVILILIYILFIEILKRKGFGTYPKTCSEFLR